MTFSFDKLTVKAQEAVAGAQSLASERGHPELDSLHLLAALTAEAEGIPRAVLGKIGVNLGQLQRMLESELERLPRVSGGSPPQIGRASCRERV